MSETILAIDTSTRTGSVAVSRDREVLGEILLNVRNTHSERLLLLVSQLLSDTGVSLKEIDAFATALGPGSFTGLRVGIATIKGLAMATGKPVIGISSLQILAMNVPLAPHLICPLFDARKKEVYAGLYHWQAGGAEPLRADAVLAPDRLLESLDGDIIFLGEGAWAYRTLLIARMGDRAHLIPRSLSLPRASLACALAHERYQGGQTVSLERLAPAYVRPSEAEIAWSARAAEGGIAG